MTAKFAASQLPDGSERIELQELTPGGLFKKAVSRVIPRAEWSKAAPPSGLAALAAGRAIDPATEFLEDETAVVLPPHVVAQLGEPEAHALGLPPATPLTLQLRSTGSLAEGTIQVETKWMRRGGAPVRADVLGARIREGGKTTRVVEPMFSVLARCTALHRADDPDSRRAGFAELRSALGDDLAQGIDVDGFIERIRIAYAANFSLDAKTSGGRFDFDPVLFGRHVQEADDAELVDEKEAALLTPHESVAFQTRFRSGDGSKKSYLLSDGTLLFLDPLLSRALHIVREKQRSSSEERREFLRSPQRVLREQLALDRDGDDAAADRLFIETRQFSERVSGIEVWRKPVLPWIKPKPNSWLPESFGLRIGDPPNETHLELKTGDAAVIAEAVKGAIERGEESIAFEGETIPATDDTLRAVDGIAQLEREVEAAAVASKEPSAPEEPLPTYFLQVGQNFETLDFARLPRPVVHVPFEPPSLPDGVLSMPKPHQKDGFGWLAEAWSSKMPGTLLADDMGLGKTYQALLFLRWLRSEVAPERPVLIVAPTGLLRNWQAEIAQHLAPGSLGPVVEAFGSSLGSFRTGPGNDIRGGTSRLDVDGWDDAGVVLTTYETMRDYHMSFARIRFSAIVYDEIQKLKNPASQMTRAAKALNGDFQLAMTGTPVENRLQDLWSIADTVYPGLLGTSREFELGYPATDHDKLADLNALLTERDGSLPPFMLRRMKDELLTGLPEKRSCKYPVEMPPEQAAAYDQVLARARALRQSGEKGAMLKVLHMLRGTSLHPHAPRGVQDVGAYIGQSARLKKTFDLLEQISSDGEKALVFCEDLEMQAFLAMAIQERFQLAKLPMCINGSVPGHRRQEMVNAFQSRGPGFDVMILSPKAGGVGLTITAANHVIHLSRWWNPAVEDQATDRAYRIGQQRPVTVHIPVATHPDPAIAPSSFDKRLDDLMERKRALSRGLLVPPETESDVEELLSDVLDGRRGLDEEASTEVDQAETEAAAKEEAGTEDAASSATRGTTLPEHALPSLDGSDLEEDKLGRPVLSVASPMEAAEKRAPAIQRVVFEQYGLRDWTIFNQFIDGQDIERIEIQDPYSCADERSRSRLVNFVKRFVQQAQSLQRVHVVAFDAESISTRPGETTQGQRSDLERSWVSALPTVDLHLIQRSRRAGGDLHDRFVRAHFSNGDVVVWDLGRGIDGVMNAKWSCVVNAFREQALSRSADA